MFSCALVCVDILSSLILAAVNLASCTMIMAVFALGEGHSGAKQRAFERSVLRPVRNVLLWVSPDFLCDQLPCVKKDTSRVL